MSYEVGRVASVEQLAQATRRYIAAAVDWIEALFSLANVDNIHDKVHFNIISFFSHSFTFRHSEYFISLYVTMCMCKPLHVCVHHSFIHIIFLLPGWRGSTRFVSSWRNPPSSTKFLQELIESPAPSWYLKSFLRRNCNASCPVGSKE